MHLHTHFPRGAHVFVILRDGTKFEDKYWSHEGDRIKLVRYGELRLRKVRSISYRKLSETLCTPKCI